MGSIEVGEELLESAGIETDRLPLKERYPDSWERFYDNRLLDPELGFDSYSLTEMVYENEPARLIPFLPDDEADRIKQDISRSRDEFLRDSGTPSEVRTEMSDFIREQLDSLEDGLNSVDREELRKHVTVVYTSEGLLETP